MFQEATEARVHKYDNVDHKLSLVGEHFWNNYINLGTNLEANMLLFALNINIVGAFSLYLGIVREETCVWRDSEMPDGQKRDCACTCTVYMFKHTRVLEHVLCTFSSSFVCLNMYCVYVQAHLFLTIGNFAVPPHAIFFPHESNIHKQCSHNVYV